MENADAPSRMVDFDELGMVEIHDPALLQAVAAATKDIPLPLQFCADTPMVECMIQLNPTCYISGPPNIGCVPAVPSGGIQSTCSQPTNQSCAYGVNVDCPGPATNPYCLVGVNASCPTNNG